MISIERLSIDADRFREDVRILLGIQRRIYHLIKKRQEFEKGLIWELKNATPEKTIDLGVGNPVIQVVGKRIDIKPKTKHPRELENWLKE